MFPVRCRHSQYFPMRKFSSKHSQPAPCLTWFVQLVILRSSFPCNSTSKDLLKGLAILSDCAATIDFHLQPQFCSCGNSHITALLREHQISYFSHRCCLEETQKWTRPFSYQASDAGNLDSASSRHRRKNNSTKGTLSKQLYPNYKMVPHCLSTQNLQSPRCTW